MRRTKTCWAITPCLLGAALVSSARADDCETTTPPEGQCPANPTPATHGEWEEFNGSKIICWDDPYKTVHAILLKTGNVLCFNDDDDTWMIDPGEPETIITLANSPVDGTVYCSGHAQLSDGRIFVAGGGQNYGPAHAQTRIFDPDALTWTEQDPIITGKRWYPTCTTTDRGHILIVGGVDNNDTNNSKNPLLFDASQQPGQQFTELDAEREVPWYPFTFQLSSGDFLMGGSHFWGSAGTTYPPVVTATLDTTIEQWTTISDPETDDIKGASAVMLGPQRVLKAGGTLSGDGAADCGNADVTDRVQMITMGPSIPSWTDVSPMNHARTYAYTIVLPDGKVLALGGCADGVSIYVPEMYDPDPPVDTWTDMACMDVDRGRHAVALLLPDGRIFVGGGDGSFGAHHNGQIFKPPYLFQPGTRPVIDIAPTEIYYNTPFKVTVGSSNAQNITDVSLIRLGAATHQYDHDQRFMWLHFMPVPQDPTNKLKIAAPPTGFVAPPGYYMLFILDDGVPSISEIVKVAKAP